MASTEIRTLSPTPRIQPPATGRPAPDSDRLLRTFGGGLHLSPAERHALVHRLGGSLRTVEAGRSLIERGAIPDEISIVVDGWAARHRAAPNGRRQILAFLLPGDVCDFDALVGRAMDSTIHALSRLQVAGIGRDTLEALSTQHPRIVHALQRQSQVAASIAREWTISIGHRNARQRIAHLLCELAVRAGHAGLFDGRAMALPLTQTDLGDACAMTPEHTNRSLRDLRDAELITLSRGRLEILDGHALAMLAGFEPRYLDGGG